MSIRVLKPFSAVATVMTVATLLCFYGLTTLSQEAVGAYRRYPTFGGGVGGRFGPGRGPIPYGPGPRIPGRFGPGAVGHGGFRGGMGGYFPGGGPGPVIRPGLMPNVGFPGRRPFHFSSPSHLSNFGPSHQYPFVPMGNMQGGNAGAGPGEEAPSGGEASGETEGEPAGESESTNNLFNYMTQDEGGLSNQAPSSDSFFSNTENSASSEGSEAAVEGMGVDEDHSGGIEDDDEEKVGKYPEDINENDGFLAQKEESKKEEERKEVDRQAESSAQKEQAREEELAKRPAKNEEAKEAKKDEPKKEKTDGEGTKEEEAKRDRPDEALDTEDAGGEEKSKEEKKSTHENGRHT